jgi:hypothetical protein
MLNASVGALSTLLLAGGIQPSLTGPISGKCSNIGRIHIEMACRISMETLDIWKFLDRIYRMNWIFSLTSIWEVRKNNK